MSISESPKPSPRPRRLPLAPRSTLLHLAALLLVGPPLTTGCGAAPRDDLPSTTSVRDSAGIEIVESASPRWGPGEGWRVRETPQLTIGDVEGDPRYELFRVAGAIRLSDGRIVVANGGTLQLRVYSASGEHLRDLGRRGSGPGEFGWIHEVWRGQGDSVMVFDAAQRRVSIFDPQGDFDRSFQLEVVEEYGVPSIAAHFSDGTLISISAAGLPVPAATGMISTSMFSGEPGIVDGATWLLTRYDPAGTFLNELGTVMESRRWNHAMTGVPQSMYLPFSVGAPIFAAGGGTLYLGDGSAFEVSARTSAGELARILRWSGSPREITRDDVARYRGTTLESIPNENQRRARERWLDAVPFPDRMPTYQGLLVDALGHLWVEQYRAPWEDRPRWWIFDPDGAWLGEVETPAGFTIHEVGRDYLLALGHGEHEIELVALFPLRR